MENKKPTIHTIIRTAALVITMLNLVVSQTADMPFASHPIYQFLSWLAAGGSAVWTWWKNNSFTFSALLADEHLESLRENSKDD